MFSAFCEALGGLALFLYGMYLAGQGLQGIAQLGSFLSAMTRGRFRAVASGVGLAFSLQSSSAATVILVSLSEASLLRLSSAFACALGAGIGTALTVELISFDPSSAVFLATALGTALTVLSSSTAWRGAGRIILGFSLLFLGMDLLQEGTGLMLRSPSLEEWLRRVTDSVPWSFLAATGLTLVVQSSAAVLAIVMALAGQGQLLPEAALPMILGANLGTCITALIASAGSTRRGRSVALWHLGFKLLGACVVLPFCGAIPAEIGPWILEEVTPRWIAHGHAMYNGMLVLLFLPWTRSAAVWARHWVEGGLDRRSGEETGSGRTLSELEAVLLEEAESVPGLLGKIADLIATASMQGAREVEETARRSEESLSAAVSSLLRKEGLEGAQEEKRKTLLRMAFTLSGMVRQMRDDWLGVLARMRERGVQFSIEGEGEVLSFLRACENYMARAVRCMRQRRGEGAASPGMRELERDLEELSREEGSLYMRHVERLSHGIRESQRTGPEHAELMAKALSLCRELNDVWRWHQMEEGKR